MLQIRKYFGLVAFKFMKCYELNWITLKYRHSNFYPKLWREKSFKQISTRFKHKNTLLPFRVIQ